MVIRELWYLAGVWLSEFLHSFIISVPIPLDVMDIEVSYDKT
jgi:hypothetical protein